MSNIVGTISKERLQELAKEGFGDMVKVVVDVSRKVLSAGGQMHIDMQEEMVTDGSLPEDLWGVRLYPFKKGKGWISFVSMINAKPDQDNLSQEITNPAIRKRVSEVLRELVTK